MRKLRPFGRDDMAQSVTAGVTPIGGIGHLPCAHAVEHDHNDALKSALHPTTPPS
jgi:hypothetical protein